jgi:hypothetical protein
VGKKPPQEIGIKVKNHSACGLPLAHNKSFRKLLKEIIGESAPRLTELNPKEFAGFQVGLLNKVGCALERSGSAHFAWYMCCLKRWPIWRVLLVLLLLLLIVVDFRFLFVCYFFFETGFLSVTLAVLELTLYIRLALNSQRSMWLPQPQPLHLLLPLLGLNIYTTRHGLELVIINKAILRLF